MKKKGGKLVPNCVQKVEIGEDKKWHYNLDRGVYRLQKDNNGKLLEKGDRQKEMRRVCEMKFYLPPNKLAKVAKLNEQVGVRKVDFVDGVNENQ